MTESAPGGRLQDIVRRLSRMIFGIPYHEQSLTPAEQATADRESVDNEQIGLAMEALRADAKNATELVKPAEYHETANMAAFIRSIVDRDGVFDVRTVDLERTHFNDRLAQMTYNFMLRKGILVQDQETGKYSVDGQKFRHWYDRDTGNDLVK